MTLQEAGKMYVAQQKKIDEVTENLHILHSVLEGSKQGPVGPFTTCIIRTDILARVTAQLEDHLKHLKFVMEKELP